MRRLVAFLIAVAATTASASAQIVPCSAVSDQGSKILLDDIVTSAGDRELPPVTDQSTGCEPHPGTNGAWRRPESPPLPQTAADWPVRLHTIARAGAERPRRADGGLGHHHAGQGSAGTPVQRGVDWLRHHSGSARRAAIPEGTGRIRRSRIARHRRRSWTICCGSSIRPAALARMRRSPSDPNRFGRRNGARRASNCARPTRNSAN